MEVILATVKWNFALVYLVDFIVFAYSFEEQVGHVVTVLRLLTDACVTHELKKCDFFNDAVYYLGQVIMHGKLEVATRTKHAIFGLREPRTVREMRSI